MSDFNGWSNHETKQVAECLMNDKALCHTAGGYMAKKEGSSGVYKDFILWMDLGWDKTPDGVSWLDPSLDYDALDKMMMEFKE